MKLIKQSYEIWEQDVSGAPISEKIPIPASPESIGYSLEFGMYKHIERVGRVCYRSEDKIAEGTAWSFIQRMIEARHYAMLEHGTVYLKVPCADYENQLDFMNAYGSNPYTKYDDSECDWRKGKGDIYITTNFRVLVENHWLRDFECICKPTPMHPKRITVHLTTSRQIANELVRHRVMSFAQESTRYCNYTKDKFGGELTFIRPIWLEENPNEPKLIEDPQYLDATKYFIDTLDGIDFAYDQLVRNCGWKPQQAANLLPGCTKTELVITGFLDDWEHLFDLRVKGKTGAPHPQMLELMEPVYLEFVKRYDIAKD